MDTGELKILAVDDNPDNLTVLKAVVADRLPKARVSTALNGERALDLARAEDPDVILLDIIMPGMDGYAVCRALKADERLQSIPVLFLTALGDDRDSRIRAVEAGAEGFFSKPADEIELAAQIRAMAKIKAANRLRRMEKEQLEALVVERTREVREVESRYRAMFENMASASCVDEIVYEDGRAVDYRILDVNPAFERLTGIRRQDAMGALASKLYGLGHAPFLEVYSKVAETGVPAEFEVWFEPFQKHLHINVGCPKPGFFSTVFTDITARKQAEEKLRESEAHLRESEHHFRTLANGGTALIWTAGTDKRCNYFNGPWLRYTGRTLEQEIGNGWADGVHPEDSERCVNIYVSHFDRREPFSMEYRLRKASGEYGWILDEGNPRYDTEGNFTGYIGYCYDITERKRAEEEKTALQAQLVQSQKMESVGRLAGGVAHDFNNMLGVILGYTEMALEKVGETGSLHDDLLEIRKAAERSASLTRQLLAFARRQTIAPKVLDLNETVGGMIAILRRLIGEDIELVWSPAPELWPVKVDPSQIDQVLANLCVNARDAIEGTGKVCIETGTAVFDSTHCAGHLEFAPGDFVMLAVSDTGCGMDKETKGKLFEPFFTTKELGKGTGLGLATIYGIVKQNNGFIDVYSEPGQGSVFKIYLPRHTGKGRVAAHGDKEPVGKAACKGHETVLLVEDEPAILSMGNAMLARLGYRVLAAATPGEAIRLAEQHQGEIDLLMTDVVMPEMDGRCLAKNIMSLYPTIKRLFMSGYTADVIAYRGVLDEGVHFIQKPFSIKALAAKLREVLGTEGEAG